MTGLIAVLLLAAIVFWIFGGKRAPRDVAPEDDVTSPVDEAELAEAEAELTEDTETRELADDEDDDDWGPGASRR